MTRSIENFLTAEEQQLITDFIKKKEKNAVTSVHVTQPILELVRAKEERDKLKLIDLKKAKRREWKESLNVFIKGGRIFWTTFLKNNKIKCPIDKFLISFTELLKAEGRPGEERCLIKKLKLGIETCADARLKCPCPADS